MTKSIQWSHWLQKNRDEEEILEKKQKSQGKRDFNLDYWDMRELSIPQLEKICNELRFIIEINSFSLWEAYMTLKINRELTWLIRKWRYEDLQDIEDLLDVLEDELESKIDFYKW